MKCLVVLSVLTVCVAVASGAAHSCRAAEEFFARHNVTADADDDTAGSICGGQCCGRGREGGLRAALRRRLGARAALAARPVAELLLNTRRTLQDHLTGLSQQSQNKTATFFTQMYKGHASRAHGPLSTLYGDIRTLLREFPEEEFGTPAPLDLGGSSRKFFRDVFPVVYHNVLKLSNKQFSPEYEVCLRDAYDAAQPFGDLPHQFATSLSHSLEAARALLQALALGAHTLAAGERVLASGRDEACAAASLRAGGCALCRGLDARPCRNYCLNVARGCVGSQLSELDAPWAGYVEGVEQLARVTDADATLRALDTRVSEAVMHALGSATLEKKVRQECGPPSTVDSLTTSPHVVTATSRRDALRAPPPDTELLQFAASLSSSKKLFGGVADRLCDEEYAWDGNDNCWNGEGVGAYIKPLVPSASVSDQRYNPEVTGGAPQDPQVATLGDKLRQARQVLLGHVSAGAAPAAEAFMQGDEAGEGSGSGRSYDDEASYDAESSGEGSGDTNIEDRVYPGEGVTDTEKTKTSSASVSRAGLALSLTILATLAQSLT